MPKRNQWILVTCCLTALILCLLSVPQFQHWVEIKREQGLVSLWILTPITFYGRVVDEKGRPVVDAKIKMTAATHPYASGTQYDRTSDASGLFSITGIHGEALLVQVSKDGYYSLPNSWGNFGYAVHGGAELPPATDRASPVVFVLRKMGETEALVLIDEDVKLSRTGAPISLSLKTGKGYGFTSPDITVQAWTHDRDPGAGHHYDWRCLITIPGGGLVQRDQAGFALIAPDSGYKPDDEIKESGTDPDWTPRVSREYFAKLASGEYARFTLTMYASNDHFFTLTSYLNPVPGHRNLEYDSRQSESVRGN